MAVKLAFRNECAVLTLNRPEALNALSFAVLGEIGAAIDSVAQSRARALIVTGAGPKSFCAGADIKELVGRDLVAQKRGAEYGQAIFAKLDALPIASVAAINGLALGGGLELALACTFRIASAGAKMACPEIKLGLIPGYGGTQRLPRLVGEARALELVMSGRMVDAAEAERIGLVNRIAGSDVLEEAFAFARSFTAFSLPVLAFARAAVQRALTVPLHEGLKIEAELSTMAYQTNDADEGLSAFLEKRQPGFRDG